MLDHTNKTNVEFLTQLMEFSQNGALMQMFVMSALDVFSREVIKADIKDMTGGFYNFVDAAAWKRCAVEMDAALSARNPKEKANESRG